MNDDDPVDAQIVAALTACLPRRRSTKARALMAAGLGVSSAIPARSQERPTPHQAGPGNIVAFELPKPAPVDGKTALEEATGKFLDAFG